MNRLETMKRATLHTLGCRLNQTETAHLAGRLRTKGYRLVEFGEPTDLLILNTCSVTQDAERESRRAVRRTLRHSPQAFVAVTGCYAQTGMEALRGMDGIDMVVGSQFKMNLPDLIPSPDAFFDPMVLLGEMATRVPRRVRIGTGVTEPIRRHPATLAQAFVTIDHLTRGRAILGIGEEGDEG